MFCYFFLLGASWLVNASDHLGICFVGAAASGSQGQLWGSSLLEIQLIEAEPCGQVPRSKASSNGTGESKFVVAEMSFA